MQFRTDLEKNEYDRLDQRPARPEILREERFLRRNASSELIFSGTGTELSILNLSEG